MKHNWSKSKHIRFFFYRITNFIITGFGFTFPEERDEFNELVDDGGPYMS